MTAGQAHSTAFQGQQRLASGPLAQVALAVKEGIERCPDRQILVFDDATGEQVDLDLRGTEAAILARLAQEKLPYVSVLTDPTTGGVSASLAMLGDINIGEPRALIGFAGPRVIAQTVRETLPEGFQRSEFLMEKGALDLIMDRRDQRDSIARLLRLMMHKPVLVPSEPAAAEA